MTPIDGDRIRSAIDAAQTSTTGRIGVHVVDHETPDALAAARDQLHAAALNEHSDRNAVVFLVAPKSRRFAVYGDRGIHERLGNEFWSRLVDEMAPHFTGGAPTEALLHGISRVGEQLRAHFPAS